MSADPIGPYSPWVEAGEWVITSGQIGLVDNTLVEGLGPQCDAALANLGLRLAEAGLQPTDVVKTTVFMVSMDDYPVVNEHYAAFFDGHRPARSAVAVAALPAGALVEIEAWAHRPTPDRERSAANPA
ncbi:MAG: RidA family protein [Microthrixaceae bacterium]